MNQQERNAKLQAIWKRMHSDYKLIGADGVKRIMLLRDGGTTLAPLGSLTDEEIARLSPSK